MAKNKNRDRAKQQGGSAAERSQEQARTSSPEAQGQPQAQGSPADVARSKQSKRFGHN